MVSIGVSPRFELPIVAITVPVSHRQWIIEVELNNLHQVQLNPSLSHLSLGDFTSRIPASAFRFRSQGASPIIDDFFTSQLFSRSKVLKLPFLRFSMQRQWIRIVKDSPERITHVTEASSSFAYIFPTPPSTTTSQIPVFTILKVSWESEVFKRTFCTIPNSPYLWLIRCDCILTLRHSRSTIRGEIEMGPRCSLELVWTWAALIAFKCAEVRRNLRRLESDIYKYSRIDNNWQVPGLEFASCHQSTSAVVDARSLKAETSIGACHCATAWWMVTVDHN